MAISPNYVFASVLAAEPFEFYILLPWLFIYWPCGLWHDYLNWDKSIVWVPSLFFWEWVESVRIYDNTNDKREWTANSSVLFSWKAALSFDKWNNYTSVSSGEDHLKSTSSFKNILQRRRPFQILSPRWCVFCKKNGETADHLFLHCSFWIKLWFKVWRELSVEWVVP